MFASVARKRSVGHSKALCTSSRSLLIPTTAAPSRSPRLAQLGWEVEKGRTLSLGAKGGSAEVLNALGRVIAGHKDSSHPFSSSAATSPTVKTKFDFIKSPEGLEHHIRDVSQLCWIGVGEREWRLSLFAAGYIALKQGATGSFTASLLRRAVSWDISRKTSSKVQSYKFDDITSLELQAAQLIQQSSSPTAALIVDAGEDEDQPELESTATWRQEPASEAQISFVERMIGTSYRRGTVTALDTCIPGGWIGRDWKEQVPARLLKSGEASDTLDRVIWGMEMLVEKLKKRGLLRPRRKWFGAGEECDPEAALEQSVELEKALRRYYFA
ncbi:hypothetical protein BCR35DRAFT_335053 [Leucosporidium creatinivorum]|uniref:Uncharacterized protein n=1 Tax=Leucosporidium creatinivorum TaxID=106004 RepID=A0A1Y2DKU7_9BASI|nr:hypothetical protein BCR35DRAFT_335053 [Leucosporidium creatinivorum]